MGKGCQNGHYVLLLLCGWLQVKSKVSFARQTHTVYNESKNMARNTVHKIKDMLKTK